MLFVAFLSFFVFPWLSPLWVINVIIIESGRRNELPVPEGVSGTVLEKVRFARAKLKRDLRVGLPDGERAELEAPEDTQEVERMRGHSRGREEERSTAHELDHT